MSRDQKRRQKALQRKTARRKQRVAGVGSVVPASPRALIRSAATWPVHECLVARKWQEEGQLVQVLIARRSPAGQVVAAAFVVDPGCLGVKNALTAAFASVAEYEHGLRSRITQSQPMAPADLSLAAKIIRESIAYAGQFGFKPHRDYYEAAVLLEGANPDACPTPIPLGGKDGKPFYVSGPYDDVEKIMARLIRAVGPGNFDYLVPLPDLPSDWVREEVEERQERAE